LFKSRLEVLTKLKKIQQGLSVCIFPEGQIQMMYRLYWILSKMVFRLAIEHQIPIVPITFGDNKRGFPTLFFKWKPRYYES
jgi:1-acyl-sn-glycerol-3-phosphate acyltransferase